MSLLDDLGAFSSPFGSPAKGKWNLVPGSFTPTPVIKGATPPAAIIFFTETRAGDPNGVHTAIDQISDTNARRLAVYEYPYKDGQRIKDLGRKGETYTFNIKFFGPNYQAKYKEFYRLVYNQDQSGTLNHPVLSNIRGNITARLQSFDPVHRHDESNAVTFRAVFIEDNTDKFDFDVKQAVVSPPTSLQNALNTLVSVQANVSQAITVAQGLLQLPSAVINGIIQRKNSILGQVSGLLGSLASTFANTSELLGVLVGASGVTAGVAGLSSGTLTTRTANGSTQTAQISPVYQVALDSNTQSLVESQIDSFVAANQITPAQAVFQANQARGAISTAISEAEGLFGNAAYDIVVQYRQLAVSLQDTTQTCISSAQASVKTYTLPRSMSLRMIAFNNGLSVDRCNDIEALNSYLGSVNLVPVGSTIVVPAS